MATDREALLLQLSADVRALQKSWDRAAGIVDEGSKRMERRAGAMVSTIERQLGGIKLPKSLAKDYEKLGEDIGAGLMKTSRAAQLAFAGISAYAIKLSADAAEIENAFDVAFKGSAKSARDFSNVLADKVGRDAVELREGMSRLQLVLTGTGVAAEQAAEMVKRLTERGVDAGSLFNTSDAEALQKIISGLSGEAEPLKAFGVVINEAAVKAELLRLGFKGNAEQASEAAKSIARANLIMKGLAVAQGDAAKTADSASNKAKAMRAEFNKAARELGEQLLPAFVQVTGAATDALKAFNDMPDGMQVAGLAILGFIAAGGPIAGLIANLARVIKLAKDTRAAIAEIGTANAAAGAGTAAGAAAGAGAGAGLTGALAAGNVIAPLAGYAALGATTFNAGQYRRALADLDKANATALDAAKEYAQRNIADLQKRPEANRPGRTNELLTKFQNDLARIEAVAAAKALAQPFAGQVGGEDTPTTPVGGFTLSGDQFTPTGDPKGKKGPRDVNDEKRAQIAAQVAAAEADVLRAKLDLAVNAQDRAALEKELIGRVEAVEDARLQGQIKALDDQQGLDKVEKEREQKALEGLRLKNKEVSDLQRQAVDREAADRIAREQLELNLADLDTQAELASLAASMARTAGERRDLELKLLDLADQRFKAEQEAIIASGTASDAAKELARQRLEDMARTRPAREALVLDQTAGPVEAFVKANASAKQLGETMEGSFVRGLDALANGLGEAALSLNSFGSLVKNTFRQLLADFIAGQARKGFADLAGAALSALGGFKLPGSSSAPYVSDLDRVYGLPGFASGTDSAPGGWARINERGPEGLAFLPPGTKVIPNDVLRALSRMSIQPAQPASATVRMSLNLEGANGDETIKRIAYQAAFEGAAAARSLAVQDAQVLQARKARGALF